MSRSDRLSLISALKHLYKWLLRGLTWDSPRISDIYRERERERERESSYHLSQIWAMKHRLKGLSNGLTRGSPRIHDIYIYIHIYIYRGLTTWVRFEWRILKSDDQMDWRGAPPVFVPMHYLSMRVLCQNVQLCWFSMQCMRYYECTKILLMITWIDAVFC